METTTNRYVCASLCALLLITLLATGCKGHKSYPETPLTKSIDSLFTSIIDENGPGAMVMVTSKDSVIYSHGFGLSRLDTRESIDENTLFSLSTTTKFISAIGIMKLVEEGCISLDTPLSELFPNLKDDIYKKIHIRHILSGSTGLPNTLPQDIHEWNEYIKTHPSIFSHLDDFSLYGSDEEFTRYLENIDTLLYEPGTQFSPGLVVNDPPYMLIPALIEKMTLTEYNTWMVDNILKPTGAEHAIYTNLEVEKVPHLAHAYAPAEKVHSKKQSYSSDSGTWKEYDYGEAPFFLAKGDNGLFISGSSYIKWRQAILDGKIVSQESLDTVYSAIAAYDALPNITHGLGVINEKLADGSIKHYMRGHNGGFSSITEFFPDKKVSYLIFMNRNDIDLDALMARLNGILQSHHLI